MKKVVFILLLALMPVVSMADDKWPYVCEQSELQQFNNDRYMNTANSAGADYYIDLKSVDIDKKRKLISVWHVRINTPSGREKQISIMSQYGMNNYSQYGYSLEKVLYDYSGNKRTFKNITDYNCDGSVIGSDTYDKLEWGDVLPNSIMEGELNFLIKKYNLK